MRLNDDEKTVAAMDILVPGVGEIVGGSQREERLDVLDLRLNNEALKAGIVVVSRSKEIWDGPPRWLWAWVRTTSPICLGHGKHPRHNTVPKSTQKRRV